MIQVSRLTSLNELNDWLAEMPKYMMVKDIKVDHESEAFYVIYELDDKLVYDFKYENSKWIKSRLQDGVL